MKRLRLVAVLGAVLACAAAAPVASEAQDINKDPVTITVENQSDQTVTIYASGPGLVRLGQVNAFTTAQVRVPAALAALGHVQVVAKQRLTNSEYTSETIDVRPRDALMLKLYPNLSTSILYRL